MILLRHCSTPTTMSNDSTLAPGAAYGSAADAAGIIGSSSTDTVAAYEPPTPTYDEVFPPLGGDHEPAAISAVGTPIPTPRMPTIGPSYANMMLKSSSITQVRCGSRPGPPTTNRKPFEQRSRHPMQTSSIIQHLHCKF